MLEAQAPRHDRALELHILTALTLERPRASAELEARLMNHPHFGPHLGRWRREGAISLPAKLLAVAAMGCSMVSVLLFAGAWPWLQAGVAIVLACCALYVLTRPSPSRMAADG